MNILHVLSGNFLAGSETYAATLIEAQIRDGHNVFIAAGNFTTPTRATLFRVPIFNRGVSRRITNTRAVVSIIRRKRIDILHAHSRAASWVCHVASMLTHTAYLSTLHGVVSLHFSSRHVNVYGRHCIAVCENIQNNLLVNVTYYSPENIHLIRNGIVL